MLVAMIHQTEPEQALRLVSFVNTLHVPDGDDLLADTRGPGWFLVGDAAGFLDPFTGEGLHRALVSTSLAVEAIETALGLGGRAAASAAKAYDAAMRRRFASKDTVSWLVQSFLARPRLFDYAARRLANRPELRATMSLVMGDLAPASRALSPRYLASVLAP